MKSLQEKRKEFLDEMVQYYSEDVTRRSVGVDGTCRYHYIDDNGNVFKCAIGRYIPDERYNYEIEGHSCIEDVVMKRLPEEIVELEGMFLSEVQELHDNELYWCSEGLTALGKEAYDSIVTEFISPFNFIFGLEDSTESYL